MTCGSAHSIAWSSVRRKVVCKLPDKIPMEFSHLQDLSMPVLRNRLILLHHFSNQFCKSLSLFGLQPNSDYSMVSHERVFGGFDQLRFILLSSSKVSHGEEVYLKYNFSFVTGSCFQTSDQGHNDSGKATWSLY